jgi:hypothetical protein
MKTILLILVSAVVGASATILILKPDAEKLWRSGVGAGQISVMQSCKDHGYSFVDTSAYTPETAFIMECQFARIARVQGKDYWTVRKEHEKLSGLEN